MMNIIDKIKIGFCALFGGVTGLVKALLDWFNVKVLSRLDKGTTTLVCNDVIAVSSCLKNIAANHKAQMTDAQYTAFCLPIDAVDALADALGDANISPEELNEIIDRVKAAIDAWKKAK